MKITKFFSIVLLLLFVILEVDCKKNPVTPPPVQIDSTSHNFVVTRIDTLGDWFSTANGVDLLDENNIWVTGAFTVMLPPRNYHQTYNLAHWNGQKWEMLTVLMQEYGIPPRPPEYSQLGGIKIFDSTKIFVTDMYSGGVAWFDGKNWTTSYISTAMVSSKLWARSPNCIYMVDYVGTLGSATYYNGQTYTPLATLSMSVPLTDVWGDENYVYTLGSSNTMESNVIFYGTLISGLTLANSYSINDTNLTPPNLYMGRLTSIFRANSKSKLWVLAGEGYGALYEIKSPKPFSATVFFPIPNIIYPAFIRGTADNDLFIFGTLGGFWHYNGSTWKYFETAPNFRLSACCVKGKTIALVGETTIGLATLGMAVTIQHLN